MSEIRKKAHDLAARAAAQGHVGHASVAYAILAAIEVSEAGSRTLYPVPLGNGVGPTDTKPLGGPNDTKAPETT